MSEHDDERERIRKDAAHRVEVEREAERIKDAEDGPTLVGFAAVVGLIAIGLWVFSDNSQTARILAGIAVLSLIAGVVKTSAGQKE